MNISTNIVKTVYFRLETEKHYPSSGYKLEADTLIEKGVAVLNEKFIHNKENNLKYCIKLTGKIQTPKRGSIQTRAFAPASFWIDIPETYKEIVILDNEEIVKCIVLIDCEGNIESYTGDIDSIDFEVVH